jgi:hypothetical protein
MLYLVQNHQLTPESNVEFDRRLQAENPAWGIRDINDLSGRLIDRLIG